MPSPFLASLRSRKPLLLAIAGFIGGAVGALLARALPNFATSVLLMVLYEGLWSAIFSAIITLALFWAQEFYGRRERPPTRTILRALKIGFLSGGLSGAIAQAVFSAGQSDTFFGQVIFRSVCWALLGALLGWRLSASVPNLGATRGVLGGALGGFIGGLGFIFSTLLLPEVFGQMAGVGILGMVLGLGIVAAERFWREASLEVIWGPREITTLAIGVVPLRIGGGDDHVFIAGLPPHAGSILLENGKVQYIDAGTGHRTEFRDGSRLKIGTVKLIVRAHA